MTEPPRKAERPDPAQPPATQDSPLPPNRWRPSDAERREIARRLLVAVDEGRLDLDEYERRLRDSEKATTMAELATVVADLPPPPEQVLVRIGEVTVTPTTAHTSAGPMPLRGTRWELTQVPTGKRRIPAWAIGLTIGLFFLIGPLSLVFLLFKEDPPDQAAEVTVRHGERRQVVRVPVDGARQLDHLRQQVGYLNSLSAG